MKTTSEQRAEFLAVADKLAYYGEIHPSREDFPTYRHQRNGAAAIRALLADLEEAEAAREAEHEDDQGVIDRQAQECIRLSEELAATRKQLEEAQTQLAAAQADNAAIHSAAHRLALESECFYLDCKDMPILSKWTEPMLNAISEVQKTRWESGISALDALLTDKERETIERCAKLCIERGERNRIAAGNPNGDRDEFYCADDIRDLLQKEQK